MNFYVEDGTFHILGSSFGISPYVEILQSTDLIHWKRLSRVVSPAWTELEDTNSVEGGTWGGFILKTDKGYRVYFAVRFNQYFAEAETLAGPWSEPVHVTPLDPYVPPGAPEGVSFNRGTGYDDSFFIDDDGTTYLLVKAGQCKWNGSADSPNNFGINLLQEIDMQTGQLVPGSTIDLSFVNWNPSNAGCGDPVNSPDTADTANWSEGPTMIKRDGYYYYFVSTHTGCGGTQYVWRSQSLSNNPDDWTPLGEILAGAAPFSGAQHMSAPIQLEDGTWWAMVHSYECNGWEDLGRQGVLTQVTWTEDPAGGLIPSLNPNFDQPMAAPQLPPSATPFLLPLTDDFSNSEELTMGWSFYDYTLDTKYSVSDRPGYLRIKPDKGETQIVIQKDALQEYAMVAMMDFEPTEAPDAAGIRIGGAINPPEDLLHGGTWREHASFELSLGRQLIDGQDSISFALVKHFVTPQNGTFGPIQKTETSTSVWAPPGSYIYLKIDKNADHTATGWYSVDRIHWQQVGHLVLDTTEMDGYDTVASGWVGLHVGMFATNKAADFDFFAYRDGYSATSASQSNQTSGTSVMHTDAGHSLLGDVDDGDWAMYGSMDLGQGNIRANAIEFTVLDVRRRSQIEVWLDPYDGGPKIATCKVRSRRPSERTVVTCPLKYKVDGVHEVYLRFKGRSDDLMKLDSFRFLPASRG